MPSPFLSARAVMGALLVLCATLPARGAAEAPAAAPPLVPVYAPDAALLQAFGGEEGLRRLADDFVDRMHADPRIGHYLAKTKLPTLKKNLADQLCQWLAGPCVYEGDSMRASHAELGIDRADSLAHVEVLQASMDAHGIDFRGQNQLLARLAPMYRDIIKR